MAPTSITEHIWTNIDTVTIDLDLLRKFDIRDAQEASNKLKLAFKNIKRRKGYHKRLMDPKITSFNKQLQVLLSSSSCKDYFDKIKLSTSIMVEERAREVYKAEVRTASYLEQTRAIKKRRYNEAEYGKEEEKEEEEEEEEEEEKEEEEDVEDDDVEDDDVEDDDVEVEDKQEEEMNNELNEEQVLNAIGGLNQDESFDSLDIQGINSSAFNYLFGNGQLDWGSDDNTSPLTEKLQKFRNTNIAGAQENKVLNDIRVFLKDVPRLCEYLKIENCANLCRMVDIPCVRNVQEVTITLINAQQDYLLNNLNLNGFRFSCQLAPGLPQSIMARFFDNLCSWHDTSCLTECQFTAQAVSPMILPLFSGTQDYEISMFDKAMISKSDYKPDVLVLLKLKYGVKVDFFVCEVKKPGCSGNKYESDFAKVHREMKAMIDCQVSVGISDPKSFSLLVEGFDCYLYQMSLKNSGQYFSRLLTQFRTIRDANDLMLLVPIINTLSFLNDQLRDLKTTIKAISRRRPGLSCQTSFTRPSFSKPIRRQD